VKKPSKERLKELSDSDNIDWTINENRKLFRKTDKWRNFCKHMHELKNNKCEICNMKNNLSVHHHNPIKYNDITDESQFSLLCLQCHRKIESWSEKEDKTDCPDIFIPHLAKSIKMQPLQKKKRLKSRKFWIPELDLELTYSEIKTLNFSYLSEIIGVSPIPKTLKTKKLTTEHGLHVIEITDLTSCTKEEKFEKVIEYEKKRDTKWLKSLKNNKHYVLFYNFLKNSLVLA
jgi:hypothetical protein